MRKMMTVLACVSALVLGAYAEDTSWFNGGIETGWPNATSTAGGEWASSSESVELSALATFAEGKLAVTATDADLQFAANDAKDASAGEVTVSSSMTFVPYDVANLPTPPEGAKGAICLAVTAGDTPVTNFYVLAKSGDANAWTLVSDFTPVAVADVTIGFKVVDSAAKVQYTIGEQSTDWLDIVVAGTTVSRAGYSGIGSVASLSATYNQAAPATVEFEAPTVANASVKVFIVGDPDEEVEAVSGKYTVPAGANVKLVYTANSGYVLSGTSTFTFDGVTSADAITLGENAPTTEAAKAKIGDVFYISLNAAIDAATSTDTVTLLDDIALTETLSINKNIAVDLNGKTITSTLASVGWAIRLGDTAAMTAVVSNGTIVANQYGVRANQTALTLEDVTVTSTLRALQSTTASDVDLVGCTISAAPNAEDEIAILTKGGKLDLVDTTVSSGAKGLDLGGTVASIDADSVVSVNGKNCAVFVGSEAGVKTQLTVAGTVRATASHTSENDSIFAISGNGTDSVGADVTIADGAVVSVTADETAIYWPNAGTLTVNGGSITGGTAIWAKSGSVAVNGGAISATGAAAAYAEDNDGVTPTGDAIVLEKLSGEATGYSDNLTASITGGTVTSANGAAILSVAREGETELAGFVSGGKFSSAISEALCANGFIPKDNGDGTYGVKEGAYVAQVGEAKYETELEALAAVQALEAAGTYPITVANLKGETITLDAMEQSVSLDAAETLTITADSWKFSGSFAGTVTLQPGKSIVAKGLKLGATINVPAGYVLNASEADADGFVTYTAVKEEEPASGFHFYLASGTCPGVDFTNVTVVAGFDYETLGSLEKKDITATLTVGDKVYEGRIDWKGDENKALIDFGTVDTEAGANLGGTITLKTGDVDIDGATGTERIIAARAVTWVSEFAQEGLHGVTGTWSDGTVWDETGVALSDTTFTPNTASGGNRVEILMDDVCFDGAMELPSETDGLKAAILIVDETEPKFAVLSNGTEWVTIDRSVYAPDATAKHCVRIIFDYVAKTVRYSVYDSEDNEIVLGEFDDKDAMGENVTKIDFSGSGKLASLQGDFWLNAVAQNPDGTYATSLADAAAGAKQIWDATYIPSKYATLALDLSEDWGLFFPEGWKYTTSVADGVTTYRFNDTDEAQILGETPTTYIFLDDAVAAATEGQTVQMLADVSGELVKQTNEVNITLDLAGKNLTGAMTEDEVPEVGTALVASGVITITNSVADAVGKVDGFLESEPKGSYQIYGGLFSEDFPPEFAPAGFYKKSEKIGDVDWYTVAKCLSIKGFFFSIADAGTYNGTGKEPTVTMKATEDGEAITADVGYSVAYSANTNAGVATATVTGTGMYMDETNLTFTIAKAPLTVTPNADQKKDVGAEDPTLTYTLADGEQLFGEDAFSGALARAEGETAGTYEINLGTLTAGDNYAITFVEGVMFTIVATADLIGSDGAMIDGIPSVADPTIKQVKFTALDLATGTVGLKAGTITLAKETTASTGFVLVCKASLTATETFTVPATLTLVADSTTDGIFTIGTEALETLRKDHPTQAFVVGIAAASAE